MGREFNFEGTSEISKDKGKKVEIEMQDFSSEEKKKEENLEDDLELQRRQLQGEILLRGNLVTKPAQEGELYEPVDFQDKAVRESIRKKVRKTFQNTMDQKIEYAKSADAAEQKEVGDKKERLQELSELSKTYTHISEGKRQKELKASQTLFGEMDRQKQKLAKEKDPKKQLAIKEEIVRLKAKALISRARAYAKDISSLNDEIANIEIAANYELMEARISLELSKAKRSKKGKLLESKSVHTAMAKAKETADQNIDKIALKRRRASGLELFRANAEQREAEWKSGTAKWIKTEKKTTQKKTTQKSKNEVKKTDDAQQNASSAQETKQAVKKGKEGWLVEQIDKTGIQEATSQLKSQVDACLAVQKKLELRISKLQYSAKELKDGTVVDKIYQSLSAFLEALLALQSNCEYAQNTETENDHKPAADCCDELMKMCESLQKFLTEQNDAITRTVGEGDQTMTELGSVLFFFDLSNVKTAMKTYNSQFQAEWGAEETETFRSVMQTPSEELSNYKLESGDKTYEDMLQDESTYGFILGGHKDKSALSIGDLNQNRTVTFTEEQKELKDLKSNKQERSNCWACSVDVLLQSRGYKLPNGYQDVMKYLPDRITTMRQAAEYYAYVANKPLAISEQLEFIEKVVGTKYSLKERTVYPGKSKEDFAKKIEGEIRRAIKDGSAVSLRDPHRQHYITVTGINDDHITYVDSTANDGNPQEVTLAGFFDEMFDKTTNQKRDPVALFWLKKG